MSSEISEDQLIHYFAGECSEEEAARIETWIDADPERKQRAARLRRIWDAAKEHPQSGRDVNAMWDDVTRRLGFVAREDQPQKTSRGPGRTSGHPSSGGHWRVSSSPTRAQRVSAVVLSILVLALAVWVWHDTGWINRGDSSMRTITTDVGQRAQIQLGDGSEVMLNADSKLELPPEFGDEKREITLVGQAHFQVVPDKRPFLVRAEGSVTRVLGTEFGVGAYPEDDKVRVVVVQGEVTVRSAGERSKGSIALTDRQMASLSKVDDSVLRREVDPGPYLAWTEGKLVFNDAPFDEVARRLKSWYGLQVELVGSVEDADRLNATYTDEPANEVLSIIAEALDLRYERDGKAVTFYLQDGLGKRSDGRR